MTEEQYLKPKSTDIDPSVTELHATSPEIGDYWHEMCNPVCAVVGVVDEGVIICKKKKDVGVNSWTFDTKVLEFMSFYNFRTWLSYGSIEGYWADVIPNGFCIDNKNARNVAEFIKKHRIKFSQEEEEVKKREIVEKWLIASYPTDHDEGNCIDDVTIRNSEKEAREEFESYCSGDDTVGKSFRVVLAKVVECVDIEECIHIRKTRVI